MSRGVDNEGCPICGEIPFDHERRVLVVGRRRRSYCSQACLRTGVRKLQIARRKARLRGLAVVAAFALATAGVFYVRHLVRTLRPRHAPVVAAAAPPPPPAAPEPEPFGPHWPPTDEEWLAEFTRATWVDPLPGPARRRPASCARLFVADPARARCRTAKHCGVDLGGELWGEHVYAAHDGVVAALQRNPDAPGGVSVRLAHWGGAVFTQYFHLAAIPTKLAVGMRVDAGDVVGLVGDTGDGKTHLHFALSVRPSSALPEVFWDPEPLMGEWPLRTPERGSVAGLTSIEAPAERVAGPQALVHHASLRRAR